jgi:hypothetical protein
VRLGFFFVILTTFSPPGVLPSVPLCSALNRAKTVVSVCERHTFRAGEVCFGVFFGTPGGSISPARRLSGRKKTLSGGKQFPRRGRSWERERALALWGPRSVRLGWKRFAFFQLEHTTHTRLLSAWRKRRRCEIMGGGEARRTTAPQPPVNTHRQKYRIARGTVAQNRARLRRNLLGPPLPEGENCCERFKNGPTHPHQPHMLKFFIRLHKKRLEHIKTVVVRSTGTRNPVWERGGYEMCLEDGMEICSFYIIHSYHQLTSPSLFCTL